MPKKKKFFFSSTPQNFTLNCDLVDLIAKKKLSGGGNTLIKFLLKKLISQLKTKKI